ncbi:MAG: hypothetical protein AAGD23_02875 [Pseudomonadota bacterium]
MAEQPLALIFRALINVENFASTRRLIARCHVLRAETPMADHLCALGVEKFGPSEPAAYRWQSY